MSKLVCMIGLFAVISWPQCCTGLGNFYLIMGKVEVVEANPDYLKNVWFRLSKLNSTEPKIDAEFELIQDLDDTKTTLVSFNGFQKFGQSSSAEYEKSLIRFDDIALCEVMKAPNYIAVQKYSNLPLKMPVLKKVYAIKNYVMDEDQLPPEIPGEYWRLDVLVTTKNVTMINLSAYFHLKKKVNVPGIKRVG